MHDQDESVSEGIDFGGPDSFKARTAQLKEQELAKNDVEFEPADVVPTNMHPSNFDVMFYPEMDVEGSRGAMVLKVGQEAMKEAYELYAQMEKTEKLLRNEGSKWIRDPVAKRTTQLTMTNGGDWMAS